MRNIFVFTTSFIAGLILIIIILCIQIPNYNKKQINFKSIQSLKPGDSLTKVLLVLGNPLEYEIIDFYSHEMTCKNSDEGKFIKKFQSISELQNRFNSIMNDTTHCCSGSYDKINKITLTYTKPCSVFRHPMLSIHIDKNLRVYSVGAKEYSFFEDINTYNYTCKWDDIKKENIYLITSFNCIQDIFERNFK